MGNRGKMSLKAPIKCNSKQMGIIPSNLPPTSAPPRALAESVAAILRPRVCGGALPLRLEPLEPLLERRGAPRLPPPPPMDGWLDKKGVETSSPPPFPTDGRGCGTGNPMLKHSKNRALPKDNVSLRSSPFFEGFQQNKSAQ